MATTVDNSARAAEELHRTLLDRFACGDYYTAAKAAHQLLSVAHAPAFMDIFFLSGACFRKGQDDLALDLAHRLLALQPGFRPAAELMEKISQRGHYSTADNPVFPSVQALAYRLFACICAGSTVLDVGSGLGKGAQILRDAEAIVVCSDMDRGGLTRGAQEIGARHPNSVQCSATQLPFADASFDWVTCVDVIEHLPDYHQALEEMKRVVRRGVLISTPHRLPENTNPDGTPRNYWHLFEWSLPEISTVMSEHFPHFELGAICGEEPHLYASFSKPDDKLQALLVIGYLQKHHACSQNGSGVAAELYNERYFLGHGGCEGAELLQKPGATVTPKEVMHQGRQRPRLHLIYAGNPLNDASIRAPETISNHLYRYLERRLPVSFSDWCSTELPDVGPDDIILGHPHRDPRTVLQRLFRERECQAKLLLFPFHHYLPHINLPFDPLVRRCSKLLAITGEYWYDTLPESSFSHWQDKMVRVDMAVDAGRFPLLKASFNPVGKRVLLYIGTDVPEKGVGHLARLLRDSGCRLVYVGQLGSSAPLFEGLEVTYLGPRELSLSFLKWLAHNCDFFVNTSVSDANPTTILEMSAIGLPVLCTPQSGYIRSDLVYSLSLTDHAHNLAVLNALQQASQTELLRRSLQVRGVIEREYTWDKFCQKIAQVVEPYL